jgi:hypothetical protein
VAWKGLCSGREPCEAWTPAGAAISVTSCHSGGIEGTQKLKQALVLAAEYHDNEFAGPGPAGYMAESEAGTRLAAWASFVEKCDAQAVTPTGSPAGTGAQAAPGPGAGGGESESGPIASVRPIESRLPVRRAANRDRQAQF